MIVTIHCYLNTSLISLILIIILTTCLGGALSSSLIDGTVRLGSISSFRNNEATFRQSDLVKVIPLDENHGQLIVDQVNSTIISIVKNGSVSSNVYLSYDNGDTYHKIHGLQINGTNAAVISSFYMHPGQSRVIYLADVINRNLFVTSNSGQHFDSVQLSFKPSLLVPHHDYSGWIIGYDDQDDGYKQIWLSSDGGLNWQAIQEDVKQFAWGSSKLDQNNTIFMITGSRNGGTTLSSIVVNKRSSTGKNGFDVSPSKTWLTNVDKFILQDKHLFAVRRARSLGSSNHQVARDLWISVGRENFRRVILPPIDGNVVDYHLVDLTEDLIIIGVLCDTSSAALLMVSDANGTEFKLSLDNVVSRPRPSERNEKNAAADARKPFIDIHKVAGINGVYIANTLVNKKSVSSETISVITYDNGATWTSISTPVDQVGNKLPCKSSNTDCSLHLTRKFTPSLGLLNNPQILSKSSAVGIIMSPGIVAASSNGSSSDLFISNDAGLSFRNILSGSYLYEIIDHGGIIVAVKKAVDSNDNQQANEMRYSTDLGATWSSVKFLPDDDKVSAYHLLPLDGGKSARFTILCAKSNGKINNQTNWIVVKIDLTSLFKRSCTDADYSTWIPHSPFSQCLLGRKTVYRRKALKSSCSNSNSLDLSKPIQFVSCNCTSSDYQCDFGYLPNNTNHGCSPIDSGSEAPPEETCEPGVTFKKSKGYRKIFGNKCSHGVKSLEPETVLCPFEKNEAPQDPHFKKHEIGLNDGFGTLIAFLIMTILCFIAVGLFLLHQGTSRIPENFRSNYHVSPSDSSRYAINVTFDNKALRSDFEYSDDEPLVQA